MAAETHNLDTHTRTARAKSRHNGFGIGALVLVLVLVATLATSSTSFVIALLTSKFASTPIEVTTRIGMQGLGCALAVVALVLGILGIYRDRSAKLAAMGVGASGFFLLGFLLAMWWMTMIQIYLGN